jgi:hypothetical protein
MKKILFLIIFVITFLGFTSLVSASLVIDQVVYEASNGSGDWLEITNEGSGSVTIYGNQSSNPWKISTTESASVKYNFNVDSITLSSGESIVLACNIDNFNDNESYSGEVVDITASGFNNESGHIRIWDSGLSLEASYEYPSSGDGSSSDEDDNDNEDDDSSTSEDSDPVLKTSLDLPSVVFAGQPVTFDANVSYGGRTYYSGRYFWNFGDGTSINKINNFEKLQHTYLYPGEYNVILEYYRSKNGFDIPDSVKQTTIKVIPLTVSISRVGNTSDFFVELKNNSNNKVDISGWYLKSGGKTFFFPENTILLANGTLILSGRVSGLVFSDQYNLKLMKKDGEVVFDYGASIKPKVVYTSSVSKSTNKKSEEKISEILENEELENILTEDLIASGLEGENSSGKNFGQGKFIYLLIFLVFIASLAVYFLRSDKSGDLGPKDEGDDFEILDE